MTTAPEPSAPVRRRVAHPVRWVAGILVLALVAVAVVVATRPSAQATQVQSPLVGRPAPTLSGTTLTGSHFTLSGERGSYVLVNFFASWCPPCQEEEQSLVEFAFRQSRLSSGAKLVGVVFNDTPADAKTFDTDWGVTWPVVADSGGSIANRFGVTAPPTTFLVDPQGTVVGAWVGPVSAAQLRQMLSAARSGELVTGGTGSGDG